MIHATRWQNIPELQVPYREIDRLFDQISHG